MADNSITLVGNLTRDPELRFTTGGKGVASFSIAVGRRYQVNGEWQEQTSYFNVVSWGQMGENAAATLTKGMRVIVSGRSSSVNTKTVKAKSARQSKSTPTKSDQAFVGLPLQLSAHLVTKAAMAAEHLAVAMLAATAVATPAATSFPTTKNLSKAFSLSPVTLP